MEIIGHLVGQMGKLNLAPAAGVLSVLEQALALVGKARTDLCDPRFVTTPALASCLSLSRSHPRSRRLVCYARRYGSDYAPMIVAVCCTVPLPSVAHEHVLYVQSRLLCGFLRPLRLYILVSPLISTLSWLTTIRWSLSSTPQSNHNETDVCVLEPEMPEPL